MIYFLGGLPRTWRFALYPVFSFLFLGNAYTIQSFVFRYRVRTSTLNPYFFFLSFSVPRSPYVKKVRFKHSVIAIILLLSPLNTGNLGTAIWVPTCKQVRQRLTKLKTVRYTFRYYASQQSRGYPPYQTYTLQPYCGYLGTSVGGQTGTQGT